MSSRAQQEHPEDFTLIDEPDQNTEDHDLVTLRQFLQNSENLRRLSDMIPRPPGAALTIAILNKWLDDPNNRQSLCQLSNEKCRGIISALIKLSQLPVQDVYSSVESWSDSKFGILSGVMAVCDGRKTVSEAAAITLTKITSLFWSSNSNEDDTQPSAPLPPCSSTDPQ